MAHETKVIHVDSWEEFKKLANTLRPSSISYTIQRAPLSKPPVGLRIVFATREAQYVFLDFARGQALAENQDSSVSERDGRSVRKRGRNQELHQNSTGNIKLENLLF